MDRLKENEIYDKFQDLCNSHKEISHFGDKHSCNTECPLRDTNRCENVFFYQQGRADAICGVDRIIQFIKDNSFDNHSFDDSFKVIGSRVIIDLLEQLKEQKNE